MSDESLNTGGSLGGDTGGSAAADTAGSPSSGSTPAENSPTIDSIFEEVAADLGAGAAPADAASAAAPPAPTAVPPTVAQPDAAQPETPPPPSPGEPPKERWADILENARTKERDAVLQQVVTQYGEALRVVDSMRSDPVGTVVQLMTELQADPRFAAQMASHAARALRASRQTMQANPVDEEPQPDLDAGNGVLLYSAQQQAKREAWLRQQFQAEMQQALMPVQQDLEQRRQQEQLTAARQQAVQQTQTRLSHWAQKPHFAEHKDAIRQRQAEYFKAGYDTWDGLALAYSDVLEHIVLPARAKQAEQQTVAQAAQKLRAATPNPSMTAPAASRKARNLDEAFELAIGELRPA